MQQYNVFASLNLYSCNKIYAKYTSISHFLFCKTCLCCFTSVIYAIQGITRGCTSGVCTSGVYLLVIIPYHRSYDPPSDIELASPCRTPQEIAILKTVRPLTYLSTNICCKMYIVRSNTMNIASNPRAYFSYPWDNCSYTLLYQVTSCLVLCVRTIQNKSVSCRFTF